MIKVLLIGLGSTTLSALESLRLKCNVQGVIRPVDLESDANEPVVNLAEQAGIPVFSETSKGGIKSLLLKLQPDCVVVSSYDRILPPELISLSTFINVHYSPLPQYRGRANVNWALINGESYAAITVHRIVPELDGGNILFQQLIPIRLDDTIADLYDRLNVIQQTHLGEVVVKKLKGFEGIPQNNAEATYCCTRLPEDGEIDWSASTKSIDLLVRALAAPFPGAYTYFHGRKLMVWRTESVVNPPVYVGRIPGRVIGRSTIDGSIDVLTGDGVLRIFEVQPQDHERVSSVDVVKSVKSTLGLQKSDLLDRIQMLEQEIIRLKEDAK